MTEATTMSDLQFQESIVDVPRRFRLCYGEIVDQMPLLLSGKDEAGKVVDVPRVPMTPRQLLYERVHGEKNVHDQNLLRDNYVDTACAVIGDPDRSGEVIVSLYSNPLVKKLIDNLNPESMLEHGALPVSTDVYREIKKNKAFIISRDAAYLLSGWAVYDDPVTRKQFWDYITEGNTELVRDHLRLVQEHHGGGIENRMGLWLSMSPGLRLLRVGSVDYYRGNAYGNGDLDDGVFGRLVGIRERLWTPLPSLRT